jgi:hypothetical protein
MLVLFLFIARKLNKKQLLFVQLLEQLPGVEAQVFSLPAGHGHRRDAQQP